MKIRLNLDNWLHREWELMYVGDSKYGFVHTSLDASESVDIIMEVDISLDSKITFMCCSVEDKGTEVKVKCIECTREELDNSKDEQQTFVEGLFAKVMVDHKKLLEVEEKILKELVL